MELKDYLQKNITDSIEESRILIKNSRKAQKVLDNLNLDNADYIVKIDSCWEREKGTFTKHNGSLKEALQVAERQFMKTNRRGDVQATISVSVQLGKMEYNLPLEYWKKYSLAYKGL